MKANHHLSVITRFISLGNSVNSEDDALKFVKFYTTTTTKKSSILSVLSSCRDMVSHEFYNKSRELANNLPESWGIGNQKTKPNLLTESHMTKLYNSFDKTEQASRDLAVIAILYGTGMRAGEIANICITDIEADGSVSWWQPKNGLPASCVLPTREKNIVMKYVNARRDKSCNLAILATRKNKLLLDKGMSKRGLQWLVKSIGETHLGINNLSPVDFRHMWVMRTIPVDVLRWRNISGLSAYFNV